MQIRQRAGWRCHNCGNTRRVTHARFRSCLLSLPFRTLVHMTGFCGLDDFWGRLHWISRTFRAAMKQRHRLHLLQAFPSIADDEMLWGQPTLSWPYPSWIWWEIRVLAYIQHCVRQEPATWVLWERHWIRSLVEVSDAWNAVEHTGGLYSRVVVQLEQWQWTYQDGWERVDYV